MSFRKLLVCISVSLHIHTAVSQTVSSTPTTFSAGPSTRVPANFSNWSTVGSAYIAGATSNSLVLVSSQNQAGSAWALSTLRLSEPWSIAFDLLLTLPIFGGADCAAFVIHADSRARAAIGGQGSFLGLKSPLISPSVAFVMQTYGRLYGGLWKSADASFPSNTMAFGSLPPTPPFISVTVSYAPQSNTLWVSSFCAGFTYTETMHVNLTDDLGRAQGYVGFAGSTGDNSWVHTIANLSICVSNLTCMPALPLSNATQTMSMTLPPSATSSFAPSITSMLSPAGSTCNHTACGVPSGSPFPTTSPISSPTPSPTPSGSVTSTASSTPSLSSTVAVSVTSSISRTASPSTSPTRTTSSTRSVTATSSVTPGPLSCGASPAGCSFASIPLPDTSMQTLVLSIVAPQALIASSGVLPSPPFSSASLTLLLPTRPSPNELLSITCSAFNATLLSVTLAPFSAANPSSFTSLSPYALSFSGSPSTGGGDLGPIALSLVIVPLLSRDTRATSLVLTCVLTSTLTSPGAGGVARVYPRYSPSSAVTLPIILLPPTLPLAYDVLVELKPGSFLSSWSSAVNVLPSSELLANTTRGVAASGNVTTIASTLPSWQNGSAVLASPVALAALVASARMPPPFSPPWALTLSGSTHVILVSRLSSFSAGAPFSNATTVSVGGVRAAINWVSPDGTLLSVTTPPYAALCGAVTTCGARMLVVGDPLASAGAAASAFPLRSPLACPPACPSDVDATLTAAGAAGGSALLAAAAIAATMPSTPPSDTSGGGLFLVSACIGYADPVAGACGNASSPLASQCAWGAGDNCQSCPSGALCPGGARLWPRPGWWAPSQDATPADLVQCAAPATLRCPGTVSAGAAAGAFPCGPGYLTGSVGCAACAPSFYPFAGTCAPCPRSSIFLGIVVPALSVLAGALSVCAFFTALSIHLMRKRNAAFWPALSRTIELVVWLWTALQALVQTARSAQAGAPPALFTLFRGLTALQFEGVAVDSTCLSISPFATAWAQFAFVGLAALIVGVYGLTTSRMCTTRCSGCSYGGASHQRKVTSFSTIAALATLSVRGLVILYAMLTNTSLATLTCTSAPLTVRGYLALASGDGTTLLQAAREGALSPVVSAELLVPGAIAALRSYSTGALPFASLSPSLAAIASPLLSSPLSVSVLARNPFQVCKEGEHAIISPVAWAVFALFSLAFPLACAVGVSASIDARMRDVSVVGEERVKQWRALSEHGGWSWCTCLQGLVKHKLDRRAESAGKGSIAVENPLRAASPLSSSEVSQRKPGTASHALVDATPAATCTPLLAALTTGSTRSSHGIFVQLDACVLLILAVPVAYNTQAAGLGGRPLSTLLVTQAGALAATLVATCVAGVAVLHVQPFPTAFAWKGPAKAWIYALAGGSSIINFLQWWAGVVASGAASSFPSLTSLVQGLSLLLLALSALLLLYLCVAFVWSLLDEGKENGGESDIFTSSPCDTAVGGYDAATNFPVIPTHTSSAVIARAVTVLPTPVAPDGDAAVAAIRIQRVWKMHRTRAVAREWIIVRAVNGDVFYRSMLTGQLEWELPLPR